jgi:hypothetical protein
MDVVGFLQAAATAALIAKLVVDGIKLAADLPRWAPVLLAFAAAEGGQFTLMLANNAVFSKPAVASGVIIGLFAWGLAIGATSLQTFANKTEARLDAALKLDSTASRADIDREVKKEENKQ